MLYYSSLLPWSIQLNFGNGFQLLNGIRELSFPWTREFSSAATAKPMTECINMHAYRTAAQLALQSTSYTELNIVLPWHESHDLNLVSHTLQNWLPYPLCYDILSYHDIQLHQVHTSTNFIKELPYIGYWVLQLKYTFVSMDRYGLAAMTYVPCRNNLCHDVSIYHGRP